MACTCPSHFSQCLCSSRGKHHKHSNFNRQTKQQKQWWNGVGHTRLWSVFWSLNQWVWGWLKTHWSPNTLVWSLMCGSVHWQHAAFSCSGETSQTPAGSDCFWCLPFSRIGITLTVKTQTAQISEHPQNYNRSHVLQLVFFFLLYHFYNTTTYIPLHMHFLQIQLRKHDILLRQFALQITFKWQHLVRLHYRL